MRNIEYFQAMSVETSQEVMDKVESLVPVFTYFGGGEIILDTRILDDGDPLRDELSILLGVPKSDLARHNLVAIYH